MNVQAAYSRFPEVNSVMAAAAARLPGIEKQYVDALHAQQVPTPLLVEIKAYLADLRSALDYLSHKIAGTDGNFPICAHANDFAGRFQNVDPATRAAIAKWQPYQGNDWLKWFNVLNNKNKHVTLVPQTRHEMVETRVTAPGQSGGVSWTQGVTFSGGVSVMGVPIDPRTQLPVPNNIVKTERITWVSFNFDPSVAPTELPPGIAALPFLKDVMGKIANAVSEIEATIS